ncbi:MAG: VCBS repeat-containing protein [Gemmatimonadetes bacterium]|nr:VCBS repeat-containing protein [Gemmatimonadota bacterium]
MFGALPRRKRRLALTVALALAFVAAGGAIVLLAVKPEPPYRPGAKVEGLTSELSRSLPADHPRVTFVDVSREAGIQFQHFQGQRTSQIPEDLGSGAAWGDYDNDGWPDVFLVNLVGPITLTPEQVRRSPVRCALYHTNRDGTFTDVSVAAGVDLRAWGMGAGWGDYDNDGRLDLVVSTYGENVLYRNNGDGTFSDRTRQAGLAGKRGFWSGVSWGDFDRDGFLDLYVAGYVKYAPLAEATTSQQYDVENPASINPNSFPAERNLLYHNNRNGTFTEIAARAGVLGERGKSLGAAWADFDEDGWPDLYVANDVTDNQLFRNRGNGTFEDISHQAHVADYRSAMGLAVGDWDGDQDTDIFITHWIAQENALYSNLGNRSSATRTGPAMEFMDEADRYGLGQIALDFVGWGTFFFDYDNDGKLDLFVVNGHTFQRRDAPQLLAPQTAQLFWNRAAREGFYDVSSVSGEYFKELHVGHGAAFADYDNDGDLDVLVVNHGGPAVLLRNEGGNRDRWLKVRLEGRRSNRTAIGAKIRVVAEHTTQVREVGAQASYLSQNDLTEHFGLGTTSEVDSLVVTWPSGVRQVVPRVASNQTLRLVEGEGARAGIREFWEIYRAATGHRAAGRIGAARDAYRRALELNPRHEDALYYLGNMALELGGYDEARSAWARLVQVNPRSARAHSRLGDLYGCMDPGAPRDFARAEAEFRRALQLNREETGSLLHLGEIALLRGDLADAISYLDTVMGSHSRSVEAHFLKGYVAWKRGQPERAAALFRTAVALARERPAVARTARCRIFDVDSASLSAPMNELYRQLDRRLAQSRF